MVPLVVLTLKAVCVEKVLALFVALDPTLGAANALASDTPQHPFTLVAVGWRRGCPHHEIVWRRGADWVDESLQRFLVHVHFLHET